MAADHKLHGGSVCGQESEQELAREGDCAARERRQLLKGMLMLGAGIAACPSAAMDSRSEDEHEDVSTDPKARPQPGDRLVYMSGDNKDKPIDEAALTVDADPILVFPMDPDSGVIRKGSRLNLCLLARVPDAELDDETRAMSADGVVAYSGVCTHHGCPITSRSDEHANRLVCNCHGSTFNAGKKGEIVVGPATRRLAILPLTQADGHIVVAAGFSGRLGPPRH